MRFILGFITSTLFIAIVFISCWLYFDFPISTNDEKQEEVKTQQIQQEEIQQENFQEQKHNGVTPPNMKEKTPNEVDESQKRKSEIQALQENDKQQNWKDEYNEINEGTDEKPYVMIDGKPVDPKHVTGKENK